LARVCPSAGVRQDAEWPRATRMVATRAMFEDNRSDVTIERDATWFWVLRSGFYVLVLGSGFYVLVHRSWLPEPRSRTWNEKPRTKNPDREPEKSQSG
jgi:hypothetical protein